MNDSIVHLNFEFNKNELLNTFNRNKEKLSIYSDYRGEVENWKIARIDETEYIKQIKNELKIFTAKPRFYLQKENSILPNHIDFNTKCSINVLLSDELDNAPITIEGIDYFYSVCLLNTQKMHSVKNNEKERILFKLSIFDLTFEETKILLYKYIK